MGDNKIVAIDGRVLMKEPTGIANVLINALNEFASQRPNWDFLILTNRKVNVSCSDRIHKKNNIKFLVKPFTQIGMIWYLTRLPLLLVKINPDYFWAPATTLPILLPKRTKSIVTIHDMVAFNYRKTMSAVNRIFYDLFFERSVNKADVVWAVSEYTKKEIKKYFPNRKTERIVVGSAIDNNIFNPVTLTDTERDSLLKKFKVGPKFILFVGTAEPRKNLNFLLSLMPRLAEYNYYLLIVGLKGWGGSQSQLATQMSKPGFPFQNVVLSGFVDIKELVALYSTATVFISTSLNEGFCLPILESMRCGCPVVAPHNSAMIELVQGAGITVSGWNQDDWIAAIEKAADQKKMLRQQGFSRAEQYEWAKVIQKLCEDL